MQVKRWQYRIFVVSVSSGFGAVSGAGAGLALALGNVNPLPTGIVVAWAIACACLTAGIVGIFAMLATHELDKGDQWGDILFETETAPRGKPVVARSDLE